MNQEHDWKKLSLETKVVAAGRPTKESDGALNPPIALNSTFHAGGPVGYGRYGNETWSALEEAISVLEGGKTLIFSSGMGAISSVFSLLPEGAVIVAAHNGYQGTTTMLKKMNEVKDMEKGNFKLILFKKDNLIKYLHCISIGIPIWYTVGLLVMNSADNFGPWLGVYDISNGKAVMYCYLGLSAGDLLAGFLSQWWKSRKKVVGLYLWFSLAITLFFLVFMHNQNINAETYYILCFLLGAGTGYWAIFVTIAAEQFGTNIRSTAANTIPNLVRGSVNIVVLFFGILVSTGINDGWSALIVGVLFISLAFFSISRLTETFGKDLNYFDETL